MYTLAKMKNNEQTRKSKNVHQPIKIKINMSELFAHKTIINEKTYQSRRQKIFNRGLYVCAGGLDIRKFDENS